METLEKIITENYKQEHEPGAQDPNNLIIDDEYDVAQELAYHIMAMENMIKLIPKQFDDPKDLVNIINKGYPDSELKTKVITLITHHHIQTLE